MMQHDVKCKIHQGTADSVACCDYVCRLQVSTELCDIGLERHSFHLHIPGHAKLNAHQL